MRLVSTTEPDTLWWLDSAVRGPICSHVNRRLLLLLAQNLCPDQHVMLHNQECYQKVWPDIPHIISLSHTQSLSLSSSLCLKTWRSCLSPIPARWVFMSLIQVGSGSSRLSRFLVDWRRRDGLQWNFAKENFVVAWHGAHSKACHFTIHQPLKERPKPTTDYFGS